MGPTNFASKRCNLKFDVSMASKIRVGSQVSYRKTIKHELFRNVPSVSNATSKPERIGAFPDHTSLNLKSAPLKVTA